MNIQYRLNLIERLESSLKTLKSSVSQQEANILYNMKELANAINSGETTDDPILDLVVGFHRKLDHALVDKYREVDNALKGKNGEFVLVTFRAKRLVKHVFIGESEYENMTFCRIGVLREENIVFIAYPSTNYRLTPSIDVPRFIEGNISFFMSRDLKQPFSVVNENIFRSRYSNYDPPPLFILLCEKCNWEEKIIIGDEAVKLWLAKENMSGLFKLAADALSKLILEPTDDV